MGIVIKRKVNLDFLGDDYKEAYIIFKALPVSEYETVIPKLNEITDTVENIQYILKILQDKFISGKFPSDDGLIDLTSKDLGSLDEYTLAECLSYITGQKIDPKLSGQ